jgi:chorismate mutase
MNDMTNNARTDWSEFDASDIPLIAGPCSAENPEQLIIIGEQLKKLGISVMRAGIWKPRTRPGSFEGFGSEALPWLRDVRNELGLKTSVEVATPQHVEEALKNEVDILWIGARTTANPFAIQELADSLRGVRVPILVKNPTNPDSSLWLGALERVEKAGVKKIGAVHRGVSQFKKSIFRNHPQWEMALQLRQERPDMLILCDPSHIAGNASLVPMVAQTALELNFDGLMIEVHPSPINALSDPNQQLNLSQLNDLLQKLCTKKQLNGDLIPEIQSHRSSISQIDRTIIELLGERMKIVQQIAKIKHEENLSIYQEKRWLELVDEHIKVGELQGLNHDFVTKLFDNIHLESIDKQIGVVYGKNKD